MFAREFRSVFEKLLSEKKMDTKKKTDTVKYFYPCEKIFFKIYKKNKQYWKGVIEKRFGRVLYVIKGQRWVHKCHLNQLKKWYLDSEATRLEKPMTVL